MTQSTTIVAFDQHAATTVAAVLLPGQRTPALHPLASDSATIVRFVGAPRGARAVRVCYEAGPVARAPADLTAKRIACDVIAPALIPRRARIGSKPIAAMRPARRALPRGGADAIHIPTEQEEAARDLLRCREDICADLLRAKHRLSKFLLRHGRRCRLRRRPVQRYYAWLRAQTWPLPRSIRRSRLSPGHRRGRRACASIGTISARYSWSRRSAARRSACAVSAASMTSPPSPLRRSSATNALSGRAH